MAALAPHQIVGAQIVERAIPGDPVSIESGKLAGKLLDSGVRAYLGVPYAAAPTGALRWREPQPVKSWAGVYNADRFAPECIQILRPHNINHYFGEEATSEDCLYLNLWIPPDATRDSRLPVVLWIYGGGLSIGSAGMANYGGEKLAARGVVYVSVGYRVGAFGFMSHPQLTAESPFHASGNYGYLDQVAALQWIQRNIERFGGDRNRVTVMGQSAGAGSAFSLQASPLAKGLFHRIVGMSGGGLRFGVDPPGTTGGRRFRSRVAEGAACRIAGSSAQCSSGPHPGRAGRVSTRRYGRHRAFSSKPRRAFHAEVAARGIRGRRTERRAVADRLHAR